jgi:hypothetical protein
MGLIHSNDCHCHCSDGLPCVPDSNPVPSSAPDWFPSFADIADLDGVTVECGPLQPAFERALKRYRNNKSLDWFDRFEVVCIITPGPEPQDDEG